MPGIIFSPLRKMVLMVLNQDGGSLIQSLSTYLSYCYLYGSPLR